MIQAIDTFLNKFTMYRLTLYYLAALLVLALGLSFFGVVMGGPVAIASTTVILLAACFLANAGFAKIWKVRSNPESTLITALVLALISGPVSPISDPKHAAVLALSGVVAIASKYILAIRRQHLFNPAAVGALLSGLVFGQYASWWVGSPALLPLVALGGLLVVRKISRARFVGVFLLAAVVFMVALGFAQGLGVSEALQSIVFVFGQTPLLFFAAVMLTEPVSSPKRFALQVIYCVLVAFLYQPQLAMFGGNLTPEQALLVGNLLSFVMRPGFKVTLPLKQRAEIGAGIIGFAFAKPAGFTHRLGQYMEWSLPLAKSDRGGNRRYFSIASSPTETDLMIAARFYPKSSRYKEALSTMEPGETITAAELGGDFVLPRNRSIPLAFIAGGIGITPFRSMLKYLVDTGERRDIVLFYSNYTEEEIVFRDVLEEAGRTAGLRTVYTLTDQGLVRPGWDGRRGFVDAQMIREEAPDYRERMFFVSGSPAMVNAMKRTLRSLGVHRSKIRTDYFPGYST